MENTISTPSSTTSSTYPVEIPSITTSSTLSTTSLAPSWTSYRKKFILLCWQPKLQAIFLTLFCIFGYGASLYANGIATKELNMNLYDTLVILGMVRGLALVCICTLLIIHQYWNLISKTITNIIFHKLLRWDILTETIDESVPPPPPPPPSSSSSSLSNITKNTSNKETLSSSASTPSSVSYITYIIPALVAFIANSGYAPYNKLMENNQEMSTLSGMISLYILIPILIGFYYGEERSKAKLFGIILSIIAVTLLGYDSTVTSANTSSSTTSIVSPLNFIEYISLYISILLCWGGGDALSGYLGRGLSTLSIGLSASCGQFFTAALYGFIRICTSLNTSSSMSNISSDVLFNGNTTSTIPIPLPSTTNPKQSIFILILANIAGVSGWLCFVLLGRIGELSTFAPLISLYVYIPVLFGIVLLHDTVSIIKSIGLLLSFIGGLCLSLSWKTIKNNQYQEDKGKDNIPHVTIMKAETPLC